MGKFVAQSFLIIYNLVFKELFQTIYFTFLGVD